MMLTYVNVCYILVYLAVIVKTEEMEVMLKKFKQYVRRQNVLNIRKYKITMFKNGGKIKKYRNEEVKQKL